MHDAPLAGVPFVKGKNAEMGVFDVYTGAMWCTTADFALLNCECSWQMEINEAVMPNDTKEKT